METRSRMTNITTLAITNTVTQQTENIPRKDQKLTWPRDRWRWPRRLAGAISKSEEFAYFNNKRRRRKNVLKQMERVVFFFHLEGWPGLGSSADLENGEEWEETDFSHRHWNKKLWRPLFVAIKQDDNVTSTTGENLAPRNTIQNGRTGLGFLIKTTNSVRLGLCCFSQWGSSNTPIVYFGIARSGWFARLANSG